MGSYDRMLASSVKDLKSPSFYRAVIGEMIGVMFLVFVGCSSPFGDREVIDGSQVLDHTRVSLSFGLSVATLVWGLANVSGGHINPAVSAGMLITRKISLLRFLFYVGFQSIGAIIGSALQSSLTCNWQMNFHQHNCTLGLTQLGDDVTAGQGVGIELLLTFVLVFTVFATVDKSRKDLSGSGPLAIGLSVTMCHLGYIRLTGSSMNPARSLGPAVILLDFTNHWVYWVGPILGGILAGLVYEFAFAGNSSLMKLKAWLVSPDYDNEEEEKEPGSEQYEMKRGQGQE